MRHLSIVFCLAVFSLHAQNSTYYSPVNSVPRAYYFDAIAGSDTNDGTQTAPWKNLTKLDSVVISPGSQILLMAGSTWTGQRLKFSGSGAEGNPIIVDKYGTGQKPLLAGNGLIGDGIVNLYNQSYIEINNLEITNCPVGPVDSVFFIGVYNDTLSPNPNPMGAARRGVMVTLASYGTANHIYLKNLDIHHIKGQLGSSEYSVNGAVPKSTGGIYISVLSKETAAAKSRFNDLLIDGCNIYYCENQGLAINNDWGTYYPGGGHSSIPADVTEYNNWYDRRYTNVKISNNVIHHIGKNAMIIRCTDETGLIEHNVCYETALGTSGNTMFTARCKGTVFQYNEGYFNRATTQQIDPHNFDGSMYDPDFGSVNIIFQYSYSHDNSMGIYWGCNSRGSANNSSGIPDSGDIGCTLRYCISQNDMGDLVFFNYPSAGNEIYNNVFYIKAGLSPNIIHEGSGKQHTYNYFNNIVYNNSSTAKYSFAATLQTRNITNNIFYGIHPSTEKLGTNPIVTDPKFISPGLGTIGINSLLEGYKVQSGSPAINSGIALTNNAIHDFWNYSVIGDSLDRGVFEYGSTILPVELKSFTYSLTGNKVTLKWTTVTEINNCGFYIEKAAGPARDFQKIGFVKGHGNSMLTNNYSFIDIIDEGNSVKYRLKQVDNNGSFHYSSEIELKETPGGYSLFQNYPNPFNPSTTIKYEVPVKGIVSLKVYDILGKEITTLVNEFKNPGIYRTTFSSSSLPTGVYFYALRAGDFIQTRKMCLMK